MSKLETMTRNFRAMPRAFQWAALAAVGFVLFLLWSNVLDPQREEFDASIRAIENQVDRVRRVQADYQANSNTLPDLIQALGQVDAPRDQSTTRNAVLDLINGLINKYDAANHSFALRSTGFLPQTALGSMVPAGHRVERLSADLKFEATPESATALIAALEASPDVESITSVRLSRDTLGKVKVQLVIEAWVYSRQAQTTPEAAAAL